jgi:hypothetical protein
MQGAAVSRHIPDMSGVRTDYARPSLLMEPEERCEVVARKNRTCLHCDAETKGGRWAPGHDTKFAHILRRKRMRETGERISPSFDVVYPLLAAWLKEQGL